MIHTRNDSSVKVKEEKEKVIFEREDERDESITRGYYDVPKNLSQNGMLDQVIVSKL